jgi:hypothetical protein
MACSDQVRIKKNSVVLKVKQEEESQFEDEFEDEDEDEDEGAWVANDPTRRTVWLM